MLISYLLFAFCGQVLAQNYYITNLVQGMVFIADKNESILWNKINDPQLLDVKTIRIELVDSDANNARFVKFIVDLPPNATSYDWTVPNDLIPKSDYFLRMSARSKNGRVVFNYSSVFSILGGSGTYQIPPKPIDDTSNGNNNTLDTMIITLIFSYFLTFLV